MKNKVSIVLIFITSLCYSQFLKGYKLISVINTVDNKEVYFYEIQKLDTDILVSSSEGVYIIKDNLLIKKSDKKGRFDKENTGYLENQTTDNNVVLIPRVDLTKNSKDVIGAQALSLIESENLPIEYLVSQGNNLYALYDGGIYYFVKNLIFKSFDGISVRSISKNYVGTYDGIYNHDEIIQDSFPLYTNSFIREFSNEIHINFDGLFVRKADNSVKYYRNELSGEINLLGNNLGFSEDSYKVNDSTYYIFSSKGLFKTDLINYVTGIDTVNIKDNRYSSSAKFIHDYTIDRRILYVRGLELKLISLKTDEVLTNYVFKSNITSVNFKDNHIYFIDEKGVGELYFSKERRILNSNLFHTVTAINNEYLALLSDTGFFKYNISQNQLTELNFNEFNRKALFVDRDTIFAGGISGLSKIAVKDFIAFKSQSQEEPDQKTTNIALIVIIVMLIGIILRLSLLFKVFKTKTENTVDAAAKLVDDINAFIDNNLSTITVHRIQEEFSLSYRKLNQLTGNTGPGKLIENKRRLMSKELFQKGVTLQEISEITGYKMEYLRKLKSRYRDQS